jgi:hypothetical protein
MPLFPYAITIEKTYALGYTVTRWVIILCKK